MTDQNISGRGYVLLMNWKPVMGNSIKNMISQSGMSSFLGGLYVIQWSLTKTKVFWRRCKVFIQTNNNSFVMKYRNLKNPQKKKIPTGIVTIEVPNI